MANTNVFETKLSNRMQITRYSTPVYTAQASFEERANLQNGQSVVRPTFGRLYAEQYTRLSDMTEQNYAEGSETLTVDQTPSLLLPVDNFDVIQHKTGIQNRLAQDGMRAINKHIDADYLAEVVNATSTVDAGDVGGSAGSAVDIDATNILKIFPAVARKLKLLDVEITGMGDQRVEQGNMKPMGGAAFSNLNPYLSEQLTYALAGRETLDGDMTGKNGYKSSYFGFDCFDTTNGLWEGVLALATQPTAGDTIVINGVTLTAASPIGAVAGNFLIGANVDATRANLAGLINAPTTTSATQVEVSAADARKLARMSAVNDDTADTLTVSAQGYGYVVVSETLTDATDAWSTEISKQMFGQKGAVDMVMQDKVSVAISDIPKGHGKYIKPKALYGLKTYSEGADALVSVDVNSASWV